VLKLLPALLFVTASASAIPPEQQHDLDNLNALTGSLKTLAASDLDCVRDSQCKTLPYGRRACGGPAGFMAVSLHNNNFEPVRMLAYYSAKHEDIYNRTYNIQSTCEIQMAPRPICDKNTCKFDTLSF
jgi:hypothetical protein